MKNLIRKILKESDDFDWIKEVPIYIPFNDVVINTTYRIDTTNFFSEAVLNCGALQLLGVPLIGQVTQKSEMGRSGVFCDDSGSEKVDTIFLELYTKRQSRLSLGPKRIGGFYVTEEMVKFYPMDDTITESDDFQWIKDTSINPWIEYEAIIFDVVPTEEDVETYIEMCLNTRDVKNATAWVDRRDDIPAIISYVKNRGNAYLSLVGFYLDKYPGGDLLYGYDLERSQKSIKYSELKAFNLNESDDLDWVRDIVNDETVTRHNVHVGMRVRMNPDSKFIHQAKENQHGTVSHINDDDFPNDETYWVYVQWDGGRLNSYRVGDDEYDLVF